jgi:hypothetical protein
MNGDGAIGKGWTRPHHRRKPIHSFDEYDLRMDGLSN